MLSGNMEKRLLRCFRGRGFRHSIELNRLLWLLDADGFSEACKIAEVHSKPLNPDLIAFQQDLRVKWPDSQAALESLRDACQQFPLASRPLRRRSRQAAVYVLLDFARWANADPEFVLNIMEQIWQKTKEAGDAGYARLIYKNGEYKYWSNKPGHNQCCFIAASLATYTQYAPATCHRVFMAEIHSCAGGLYNFKRLGRGMGSDAGEFAFFGLTEEAMLSALDRQSTQSHRIYNGGWE